MNRNWVMASILLAVLTTTALGVEQDQAAALPEKHHHHRYRLVDLGTFGGPASYLTDPGFGPSELVLNKSGMLVGKADTSVPDPNGPDNCFVPSCFLPHAFLWDRSVLTDLGTLPGGSASDVGSINARGGLRASQQPELLIPLPGA